MLVCDVRSDRLGKRKKENGNCTPCPYTIHPAVYYQLSSLGPVSFSFSEGDNQTGLPKPPLSAHTVDVTLIHMRAAWHCKCSSAF